MTVFGIAGTIVLLVIISLFRVDGDLLHCEPYYLKDEIDRINKNKKEEKALEDKMNAKK